MSQQPAILVDGYNLILRMEKISSRDENALRDARNRLLGKLSGYAAGRKTRVTVIFDGRQEINDEQTKVAGVRIIFSKPPDIADSVIKRMVDNSDQPRNITVVTSDNGLAYAIKSQGANHMSIEEFIPRLERKSTFDEYQTKYDVKMSKDELNEWLEIFNDDE